MTKNGVCQDEWIDNGRCVSNPEWVLCQTAFEARIQQGLLWITLMAEPPKNLLAYGK